MSWFFGKKKHHRESPPDTPEEPSVGATNSDGYIVVEKEENPLSPTSPMSGGLYPYLGDRTLGQSTYSATPQQQQQQQQQAQSGDTHNYLNGIPFKLSKSFDNDYEIDSLRIDEITSFVRRINNENHDYDFGLEISVINEMQSGVE